MSILAALAGSNQIHSIEEVFRQKDLTSAEMRTAILAWYRAYFGAEPDEKADPCQRLPVTIVNKLYKTVFSEYTASAFGAQAAMLQSLVHRLDSCRKRAMQMALIGGECLVKPVICADRTMDFVLIDRRAFTPFGRDARGRLTSVGTSERTVVSGMTYTLLERRTLLPDGALRIESRLFRAPSAGDPVLGIEIPLDSLPQYAGIQPELVLPGIGSIGMAQLRVPLENTVDGSPDAVSVYAPAMGLIRCINVNEQQLNNEFAHGASRIIASADMIRTDPGGKKHFDDDLFVGIDDDPHNVGVTIFSPALREASYLARKQDYLRSVENLIGLKRGILSEVEAAERTATEITSSAGDYNLTVLDFQQSWRIMVDDLMRMCMALGAAYHLLPESAQYNPDDLVLDFGDGVLYDRSRQNSELMQQVSAGLLQPERYLGWYYELPCDTEAQRAKIRRDYMPPDMTEDE